MFHKEGHKIILISFFIVGCLFLLTDLIGNSLVEKILQILLLIFFLLIIQFFRNPKRNTLQNDKQVISPVDGKVVVIEEVTENEYFKDKRLQVSIFMSPINVHVTRYPIGGKILFSKYHPGKYLFAWHPKSSEENERTTVVIENKKFGKLLYRQIKDKLATQGNDAGFIKFGSRVDLFLPLDCEIKVTIDQKVRGGEDIIAEV
jgi:phosphatidylserine decarboxylase